MKQLLTKLYTVKTVMKRMLLLAVVSLLVGSAYAQTDKLYYKEANNTNTGAPTTVTAPNWNINVRKNIFKLYLKFDISEYQNTESPLVYAGTKSITKAILNLYLWGTGTADESDNAFVFNEVDPSAWSASTLTYNTRPTEGATIAESALVNVSGVKLWGASVATFNEDNQVSVDISDYIINKTKANASEVSFSIDNKEVPGQTWQFILYGQPFADTGEKTDPHLALETVTQDETTYTRDFLGDGGFETICLPIDVTEITDESGNTVTPEIYYLSESGSDNTVTFTELGEDESMEAGTPYLIKFSEEGKYIFKSDDVTPNEKEPKTEVTDYALVGTYEGIPAEESPAYYVLDETGAKFVKAGDETFVGAYRAYLVSTGSNSAHALTIKFDDGGATGIKTTNEDNKSLVISNSKEGLVISSTIAQTINIYTIDGRIIRTLDLQAGENTVIGLNSGYYLINNKKVIVF